jgi:hypothetical protein
VLTKQEGEGDMGERESIRRREGDRGGRNGICTNKQASMEGQRQTKQSDEKKGGK